MGGEGLEPSTLTGYGSEPYAYTNSAIRPPKIQTYFITRTLPPYWSCTPFTFRRRNVQDLAKRRLSLLTLRDTVLSRTRIPIPPRAQQKEYSFLMLIIKQRKSISRARNLYPYRVSILFGFFLRSRNSKKCSNRLRVLSKAPPELSHACSFHSLRVPGLEPGTSRLSVERSNHLSYTRNVHQLTKH